MTGIDNLTIEYILIRRYIRIVYISFPANSGHVLIAP